MAKTKYTKREVLAAFDDLVRSEVERLTDWLEMDEKVSDNDLLTMVRQAVHQANKLDTRSADLFKIVQQY